MALHGYALLYLYRIHGERWPCYFEYTINGINVSEPQPRPIVSAQFSLCFGRTSTCGVIILPAANIDACAIGPNKGSYRGQWSHSEIVAPAVPTI